MINNTMRVSGLASGMDTDQIIKDLMAAERIPMTKMQQDQEWLTWQRDAYRETNSKLSEFKNLFRDLKFSKAYQSKQVTTSALGVTASATSAAQEGKHSISVSQLASKAMRVSETGISGDGERMNPNESLSAHFDGFTGGTYGFKTYDENGQANQHEVTINDTDSLKDVFKKISEASDGAVRAYYDTNSDKVFMERASSGNFNPGGEEITFDDPANSFFTNVLNLTGKEIGGKDAEFTYNGVSLKSKENSYTLDGVTYQFNQTVDNAVINVQNDTQNTFDKITEFVDKYNELIEFTTDKTGEKRHRDFPPLTEEQKEEMTENEIELWEEKAKSGLLRSDNIIQSGMRGMRTAFYSDVQNDEGAFNRLADIGITTSKNYRDNGKLVIDEDTLRGAIENNAEDVRRLFSNPADDDSRGLLNRVEDSLDGMISRITDKAGNDNRTEQTYTMGRELLGIEERITDFERRLKQVESRYYKQFTQMETAIQRMNQQSAQLMSQLGGGQQ
ncbi:flagellar hook-associated protein 2 [Allobacillus sp. SKP2-8]|uniref:flagellar hook-associated protein 2 n=1 Tax=unclassified Allobacillus TaxID=2628859 RepID=UPI00118276C1|nr:flagellar hook-associated protein 2 [Allobacillus sp. SKP2-8]TSJ63720.1 flagellar hook-associated protein 2 [Allobacillus sp. SKP2-8]